MPYGKFIWNELNTHDVEAAKRFYAATVGWTFEAAPMPDFTYWVIKAGDERVGGMFTMAGHHFEGVRDHWLNYLEVDEVDRRAADVGAAGGKVLRPPVDIPDVGRMAVVMDPGGAALAIMTPSPRLAP